MKNLPATQELREMKVRSLGQEDVPGGGHGDRLQCSCLEDPMDRGAWRVTVHSVAVRHDGSNLAHMLGYRG